MGQSKTSSWCDQRAEIWLEVARSTFVTIWFRRRTRSVADSHLAFGVDLLIPSLAETARKTNYDYTKGQLDDLISVIIEEGTKLFVCAVGVPPEAVVKRLHDHGIFCMNVSGTRVGRVDS